MRKLKDVVCIFGIGCLSLVCLNTTSLASTGKVTTETVKMRSEPSKTSSVLMLLSLNDKVEVDGNSGDWYKVSANGKKGYIHKDYIKVEGEKVSNTNNITASNNTTVSNTVDNTITSDNLDDKEIEKENVVDNEISTDNNITETETSNEATEKSINEFGEKKVKEDVKVYIVPLINASNIGNLENGKVVNVVQNINGWSYITLDTISGWIRSDKLTEVGNSADKKDEQKEEKKTTEKKVTDNPNNETKKEEKKQENKTSSVSKTGYIAVGTVNLRKEMSTSSQIIANLSLNDKVEIIGEENNWYKVKVNGKQGYVSKKLVSNKKQEATTSRGDLEDRSTANTVSDNSKSANAVVSYAKSFLGSRYVSGGTSPSGFDCSGFTYYVYKNFGVSLNRASSGQASNGKEIDKSNLVAGDLVLFSQGSKKIGHVGIYIGNNQFIHAANARKGVIITSLSDSYYTKNYVTARRVL